MFILYRASHPLVSCSAPRVRGLAQHLWEIIMSWDPLHGPGHNYSPHVFSLASSWTGPGVVHLSNDECQSNARAALSVNGECRCSERRVKLNANAQRKFMFR